MNRLAASRIRISLSQAIQSSSCYLYTRTDYRAPVIATQGPDKPYRIESHDRKRSKPTTIPTTPRFFAHSQNDTTPCPWLMRRLPPMPLGRGSLFFQCAARKLITRDRQARPLSQLNPSKTAHHAVNDRQKHCPAVTNESSVRA